MLWGSSHSFWLAITVLDARLGAMSSLARASSTPGVQGKHPSSTTASSALGGVMAPATSTSSWNDEHRSQPLDDDVLARSCIRPPAGMYSKFPGPPVSRIP